MSAPVCQVCEAEDNVARHFGGEAICRSCKVFFRRCVKANAIFVCLFDQKCPVVKATRSCCRSCRYEKCRSVGMNEKFIHSDRILDTNRKPRRPRADSSAEGSDLVIFDSEPENPTSEKKKSVKQECSLMIASSKLTISEKNCPLGVMQMIPLPDREDTSSVVFYLRAVDELLDSFFENDDVNHALIRPGTPPIFDLDQPLETVFLLEPRKMCRRSRILWEPLYEAKGEAFKGIWCRLVPLIVWRTSDHCCVFGTAVHFIDWASHLPEFQQLQPEDQLVMLLNRQSSLSAMSIAHRTLRFAPDRVVLMSGGCFYKLKGKEEDGTSGTDEEESLDLDYTMRYVLEAGTFMYETFADPCRELDVSDEELRLLRAVAFFQPVPRLSPKGREAVLEAQHFYRGLLEKVIKKDGRSGIAACERMGALLSLLPPVEFASQIEDTFMSLATLFNVGEMEGDLTCDLYLRRKGRY